MPFGCKMSSNRYAAETAPAVDDVSLDVVPGEFLVLLGSSGSGKTTLLKMVNRLIEPTSGSITIDGTEVHTLSAPELRRTIGYVIAAGCFRTCGCVTTSRWCRSC